MEHGVERVVIGSVHTTRRIWAIFSHDWPQRRHTHLTLKCACVCVCASGRAAGFIGIQPQLHLVNHLCAVSLQSWAGIKPRASSVSWSRVETALQLMQRVTDFFFINKSELISERRISGGVAGFEPSRFTFISAAKCVAVRRRSFQLYSRLTGNIFTRSALCTVTNIAPEEHNHFLLLLLLLAESR